ncbi:MAG TPA: methyltransferase domain-containing protein [Solirubrobacterales bacterium]|nr:methyltransferase domain-containing protein [Solirubrobacterales bacterium]
MELEEYRARSLKVWDAVAAGWGRERELVWKATRVVGEDMVAGLDPKPGDTVLELAAGTGDTGFAAAARIGDGGKLISSDFAPAMVEEARANASRLGLENVEFRVLDAERMDLDDDSVDGVLCKYGYMLMADPAAALGETRRVLREGGRLSFSVWGPPEHNPWASVPGGAMVELGHVPPPQPGDPGILAMSDPARIRELVTGAGFGEPRIKQVEVTWPIADLEGFHRFIDELAGPLKLRLDSLSEEDRAAAWEEIERRIAPILERGNGIEGLCHNVVAE